MITFIRVPLTNVVLLALAAGLSLPSLSAQSVIVTVAGKEFVYPRKPTASLNAPLGPVVDVAWGADALYIADPRCCDATAAGPSPYSRATASTFPPATEMPPTPPG